MLAWHLLTKDEDYRWSPATLTADKVRRLELAAGAPRRFALRGTARGARAERANARIIERRALETAEAAYRALVADRQRSDAAAPLGSDSLGRPEAGRAARRSL